MLENPEERELLVNHLKEVHIGARSLEKISSYDKDMAEILDEERIKRFEIDRSVRDIVLKFVRGGIKPKEIPWLIEFGMRCKLAVARGKPIPKDWPRDH